MKSMAFTNKPEAWKVDIQPDLFKDGNEAILRVGDNDRGVVFRCSGQNKYLSYFDLLEDEGRINNGAAGEFRFKVDDYDSIKFQSYMSSEAKNGGISVKVEALDLPNNNFEGDFVKSLIKLSHSKHQLQVGFKGIGTGYFNYTFDVTGADGAVQRFMSACGLKD